MILIQNIESFDCVFFVKFCMCLKAKVIWMLLSKWFFLTLLPCLT